VQRTKYDATYEYKRRRMHECTLCVSGAYPPDVTQNTESAVCKTTGRQDGAKSYVKIACLAVKGVCLEFETATRGHVWWFWSLGVAVYITVVRLRAAYGITGARAAKTNVPESTLGVECAKLKTQFVYNKMIPSYTR